MKISIKTAELALKKGYIIKELSKWKQIEYYDIGIPQSTLQKYLRELPTPIIVTPTTDFIAWEVEILHPDKGLTIVSKNKEDKWFNSYEEALEAGLFNALNLID